MGEDGAKMTREATPTTVAMTLDTGEEALAVGLDGERLHVVSPRPFAPGAPLSGTLALEQGALAIEVKTQGSKLRADGAFDVVGRLINLTRPAREALVGAFAPSA